jgi:hypothetical protein
LRDKLSSANIPDLEGRITDRERHEGYGSKVVEDGVVVRLVHHCITPLGRIGSAKIVGGKIIVRGGSGQVDPDGTLHSVGAGNGMTLTAVGQLSGNTGSGTFNRSDGCVGSWIAIKRGTLRGRPL